VTNNFESVFAERIVLDPVGVSSFASAREFWKHFQKLAPQS
jgi:hypothetical protein